MSICKSTNTIGALLYLILIVQGSYLPPGHYYSNEYPPPPAKVVNVQEYTRGTNYHEEIHHQYQNNLGQRPPTEHDLQLEHLSKSPEEESRVVESRYPDKTDVQVEAMQELLNRGNQAVDEQEKKDKELVHTIVHESSVYRVAPHLEEEVNRTEEVVMRPRKGGYGEESREHAVKSEEKLNPMNSAEAMLVHVQVEQPPLQEEHREPQSGPLILFSEVEQPPPQEEHHEPQSGPLILFSEVEPPRLPQPQEEHHEPQSGPLILFSEVEPPRPPQPQEEHHEPQSGPLILFSEVHEQGPSSVEQGHPSYHELPQQPHPSYHEFPNFHPQTPFERHEQEHEPQFLIANIQPQLPPPHEEREPQLRLPNFQPRQNPQQPSIVQIQVPMGPGQLPFQGQIISQPVGIPQLPQPPPLPQFFGPQPSILFPGPGPEPQHQFQQPFGIPIQG